MKILLYRVGGYIVGLLLNRMEATIGHMFLDYQVPETYWVLGPLPPTHSQLAAPSPAQRPAQCQPSVMARRMRTGIVLCPVRLQCGSSARPSILVETMEVLEAGRGPPCKAAGT